MSFSGRDDEFLVSTITNDGFFPNLALSDLQNTYRIPASAPQETVEHQLTVAMEEVNGQLVAFKASWIALGLTTLALAEASPTADGKKLTALYKKAVYSWAKAELLEDFETFSRREIANNQANQEEKVWISCKSNARRAIKNLLGLSKSLTVELM